MGRQAGGDMVTPMKSRLTLLLLAAHAGTALAQYKCTAANGGITFQQTPCFGAKSEEKLVVIPNGHPPAASGVVAPPVIVQTTASAVVGKVETNVDKKMLANFDRQRQRDALAQNLKEAQDDKERRTATRAEATAAARKQFGDDPGNAKALKDAIASINSRYGALAELDDTRIKAAQGALDNWDKAQMAAARAAARPASK
jgi:hypothetical protein